MVIGKFDPKLSDIFQEFFDRAINFGAHPNPSGVLNAVQRRRSDDEVTLLTLTLGADEKTLLVTMKSTAQVGLAALFVFQHIYNAEFKALGVSPQMELLCQENL